MTRIEKVVALFGMLKFDWLMKPQRPFYQHPHTPFKVAFQRCILTNIVTSFF